jgi:hypothetical protein
LYRPQDALRSKGGLGVRGEYRKERKRASLQAKHSRNCGLARAWTPFRDAVDGCTCEAGPVYYVVVREGSRAGKAPGWGQGGQHRRRLRITPPSIIEAKAWVIVSGDAREKRLPGSYETGKPR